MSLDTYDRCMWACHNARFDPSHSPTNADMDGIAVAIVSESCPRRTWSPEDIDAGIQASFLRIYSIFLSTLFSVGRQQLSLFDANFALTVSTSPLTVYLSAASCCDLLGIKTGLYKRIKSHRPVTRVLGAQIPLLSFVLSMIITLSDRALIDSQALVLGADRCQRAKTARAWCRAWLAIGKCEKEGWQKWQDRLSACSAMSDKVDTGTCIPQFTPSTTLHIHLEWRVAKSSMNSSLRTSPKLGEKNPQTKRYTMRCNYCRPGKVLKRRELRCPILQEIGLFSHP